LIKDSSDSSELKGVLAVGELRRHIAYRVKPLGITYNEFVKRGSIVFNPYKEKKYEKRGFATPSSKLELSSSILEKLGYDPLPFFEEPAEWFH
jgi:hypothetical protein